jgi:DNA repair protein RadD
MNLRDYQQRCIDGLRNAFSAKHRRVLLVAPTGAGKTVMFSYLTQQLITRGNRVLLLAHRDFLLEQISETLRRFDIQHGFIAAKRKRELCHLVQVAGVHTLKNRIPSLAWKPDWVICDEAHHATAGSWNTILEAYPAARVVGVTATPQRLDGRGLGEVFEEMVLGPKVQDLMDQGFLSRVHYYSPKTVSTEGMHTRMGDYVQREIEEAVNTRGVTGHAVEWYRKVCDGAPAITFCASIAHSEQVAEGFREAGYRWQALHSHASYADNQAAIRKLANGELQGVSSCDIISEGFDVPVVTAAILLRPTKSLGLHLQQIGRVLRPAKGKEKAIVIDHVGNVAQCKAGVWTLNHGRAEDDREWSLDGKKKGTAPAPMKRCPECLGIIAASARFCPLCQYTIESERNGREVVQLEGDLETLPQWLPPPETGLRKRILEEIDRDGGDPFELIPEVPENCYAQEFTEALRLKVARFLEDYTVTQSEPHWNRFKELLAEYLKRVTGALCASAEMLEDFQSIADLNGYKPGWAYYRHQQKKNYVRN